MKSLTITKCNIINYYRERINRFGWGEVLGISDTGYPRFLATGLADYTRNDVLVIEYPAFLKNYYRRLVYHEFGHLMGLEHLKDKNDVMYPNFMRGDRGIEAIRDWFIIEWNFDIEEYL